MAWLSMILRRTKHGAVALSDWLRTYKILESRDIPTAFYARKFELQLVETRNGEKYISCRIFGDEMEARATFDPAQAARLQDTLGQLIDAMKGAPA
jgi:hypothetical protein